MIPSEMESGCPQKSTSDVDCPMGDKALLGYNEAASDEIFDSRRQPKQKITLDTKRDVSSIPKSHFNPEHQPQGSSKWVYPSEQQYYNAMRRKGYNPPEQDIPIVLKIHNLVNEKGWTQIKEWESLSGNPSPKLLKFQGRPKDISPKAFFLNLFG